MSKKLKLQNYRFIGKKLTLPYIGFVKYACLGKKPIYVDKQLSESIKNVLQWTSMLTAEDNWLMEPYFWTDSVSQVYLRLRTGGSGLIGVIGYQGVGKSSAFYVLEKEMKKLSKKRVFIKWTENWKEVVAENFMIRDEKGMRYFETFYLRNLNEILDNKGKSSVHDFTLAQRLLSKGECKKAWNNAILDCLAEMDILFIDFPDYSKGSKAKMNADLDEFQTVWDLLSKVYSGGDASEITFVLAIQKELWRSSRILYGAKCVSLKSYR